MVGGNAIANFVLESIKNYHESKYDIALSLVCSAIDATSKKEYPGIDNNGKRIKKFLAENTRIISVFGLPGIACSGLRIGYNPPLGKENKDLIKQKDQNGLIGLEDVIYHAIRCNIIHECKPDPGIKFIEETMIGDFDQEFYLPSRILIGLLFSVIFSSVNEIEKTNSNFEVKIGDKIYGIDDLWGKKDEILEIYESEKDMNGQV